MTAQESEGFYLGAVTQDWRALASVPEEFKTPELCLVAVTQNWQALEYVPEQLRTAALSAHTSAVRSGR